MIYHNLFVCLLIGPDYSISGTLLYHLQMFVSYTPQPYSGRDDWNTHSALFLAIQDSPLMAAYSFSIPIDGDFLTK
jgi:hypothetical protein